MGSACSLLYSQHLTHGGHIIDICWKSEWVCNYLLCCTHDVLCLTHHPLQTLRLFVHYSLCLSLGRTGLPYSFSYAPPGFPQNLLDQCWVTWQSPVQSLSKGNETTMVLTVYSWFVPCNWEDGCWNKIRLTRRRGMDFTWENKCLPNLVNCNFVSVITFEF